jgi:hypothetical protein
VPASLRQHAADEQLTTQQQQQVRHAAYWGAVLPAAAESWQQLPSAAWLGSRVLAAAAAHGAPITCTPVVGLVQAATQPEQAQPEPAPSAAPAGQDVAAAETAALRLELQVNLSHASNGIHIYHDQNRGSDWDFPTVLLISSSVLIMKYKQAAGAREAAAVAALGAEQAAHGVTKDAAEGRVQEALASSTTAVKSSRVSALTSLTAVQQQAYAPAPGGETHMRSDLWDLWDLWDLKSGGGHWWQVALEASQRALASERAAHRDTRERARAAVATVAETLAQEQATSAPLRRQTEAALQQLVELLEWWCGRCQWQWVPTN